MIAQIAQHGLAALDVFVEGAVGGGEEGILAQGVVLALSVCAEAVGRLVGAVRVCAAAAGLEVGVCGAEERVHVLASPSRAAPSRAAGDGGIGVRVLGRVAGMWSASEELTPVVRQLRLLSLVFEFGESRAAVLQFGPEVGDALAAFARFVGDELAVDGALVVVEGAREGGEGGGELALQGGVGGGRGGEGVQVGADGFRPAQGGVVERALWG